MDSIRSETRAQGLFVIHEVEEEETLYSIAKRYQSTVQSIKMYNEIDNNRIEIGQVLSVLFKSEEQNKDSLTKEAGNFHLVLAGETLYSISKKYDIRIKKLRTLNKLQSNDISPGMFLRISEENPSLDVAVPLDSIAVDSISQTANEIPEGFEKYFVQTGETLNSISRKRSIAIDSIKVWNNLDSDYLRIGQPLLVRIRDETLDESDSIRSVVKLNEDGFNRVYEEGIAAVISEISTTKYLALHRTLPIGTELEVRNLMNNLVVHVKVVGKLPNTGLNRNILLRLSKPAYEQLGILDPKSRVEVSYFKQ